MDGADGYEQGPFTFAPGQTAFDGYPGLANKQYGEWQAQGWWVPQAWADGDPGHDWGFMLLYPHSDGAFPGDSVGAYDMFQNIRYSGNGDHVQLSGYPAEGLWTTLNFDQGVNQYYVEGGWDGLYQADTHGANNYMLAWSSTMTGGSSGGPILVELGDHTWVIGGVISQGHLCCGYVRGFRRPVLRRLPVQRLLQRRPRAVLARRVRVSLHVQLLHCASAPRFTPRRSLLAGRTRSSAARLPRQARPCVGLWRWNQTGTST